MSFIFEIFVLLKVICLTESLHFGHTLEQQKNWHKLSDDFAQCAYGVYQTPIHIEDHRTESIVMPALDFSGYQNYLAPPIRLTNNGHTVRLTPGIYTEEGLYKRPSISGGFLTSHYTMESFHFHWGSENSLGSEHVINDIRYPMEMHIVHKKENYTWEEALERRDGIVVLAFFFQLQVKDNNRYRPIVKKLKDVSEEESTTLLDKSFSLSTLLPRHREYFYTYEGSLTTPPCSEAVTWFIFPDPIRISFRQMSLFRLLSIRDNFRLLQPVGQRKVFFRYQGRFMSKPLPEYSKGNVSSRLFWLRM